MNKKTAQILGVVIGQAIVIALSIFAFHVDFYPSLCYGLGMITAILIY